MTRLHVDLCVIGAGSGGLSVAAGAVQMGARVTLIEGAKMGGDCLNFGCVPSKALLAAARAGKDHAAAMAHVAEAIAAIAPHDSEERFTALGCTVIRAFARFTSPREVEAGGTRITARRFVIATGARPAIPKIPGLDTVPFLTNETLFDPGPRPGHLLILGGGPLGVEMAQAHRQLGCAVTVIEASRILGREEPELAALVIDRLRAEGVTLIEGASAIRAGREGEAVTLALADGRSVTGTHLLLATGRVPALEALDLPAAGIETEGGRVKSDARLRTTNRRVFAIGDATSARQFTHLAGYHAGLVVRQALLALPARARADHIPRVTYTVPELAHIGLTEAEARERHGKSLTVITLPFSETDRAVTDAAGPGLVKLMVHRGRPVGVGIAGPQAGELIAPWALALTARLKLSVMASTVLPYPTLSEVSKRAAGTYFSGKLFDNAWVRRVVRAVQRVVP
ncbi:dihydrolipoyl dehydrogenase family protein [Solirhodobacter olei]|uniref:dihydrolipoyl dehydrogenase family protein n=1 Tax=Solirhodobacter olei TaxID=2493082 RepID=UPI000FD8E755|nr:FAD-dependent oxidoreductase [Solirhodobacter olei]